MNSQAKKRLVLVGLIVIVVAVVLFVVLGSGGTARALSVSDAASGSYDGKKVQISGTVVDGSYTTQGATALFEVADDANPDATLAVSYDGALPATFGNGVTAICTGTVSGSALACSELVTKCPSKYESAEGALTVDILMDNPNPYIGTEVKLAGYVTAGTLAGVDADVRFNLNSQGAGIDVVYDGALPDGCEEGTAVVVTGALAPDAATFEATDVAVDSSVASSTDA